MSFRDEWDYEPAPRRRALSGAGTGAVRFALLFGSAAAALALILTPLLDRQGTTRMAAGSPGIDWTTTGSVAPRAAGPRGDSYVLRRSVLQTMPGAVCIIRADGTMTGDC